MAMLMLHKNSTVTICHSKTPDVGAVTRNADIVMFGHTHKPYFSQKDGLTVLNPGSLSYPRQDGRKPSYMVMEIDEEGKAHYEQKYH